MIFFVCLLCMYLLFCMCLLCGALPRRDQRRVFAVSIVDKPIQKRHDLIIEKQWIDTTEKILGLIDDLRFYRCITRKFSLQIYHAAG